MSTWRCVWKASLRIAFTFFLMGRSRSIVILKCTMFGVSNCLWKSAIQVVCFNLHVPLNLCACHRFNLEGSCMCHVGTATKGFQEDYLDTASWSKAGHDQSSKEPPKPSFPDRLTLAALACCPTFSSDHPELPPSLVASTSGCWFEPCMLIHGGHRAHHVSQNQPLLFRWFFWESSLLPDQVFLLLPFLHFTFDSTTHSLWVWWIKRFCGTCSSAFLWHLDG